MLTDLSILEGEYLRDLLDQPRAVADTVTQLPELPKLRELAEAIEGNNCQRIVLTGMGASFHALHPLYLRLIGQGASAVMVETSELVHCMPELLNSRSLLIAVSQSGNSVEMIRLLERRSPSSCLIGITNTPDSALSQRADVTILTHAGQEFSVSCKTYVATLLALEWVGDSLSRNDLSATRSEMEQAAPAVQSYLAHWKEHVRSLCAELASTRFLFLTGRGSSLAAVGTGGLIIKESARFPAEGMSSAAFRHGPFEMLNANVFVLVFAGDAQMAELNGALVRDICRLDGRAALVSSDAQPHAFRLPMVPGRIRAVVEILPAQMISLALALLAGQEPGRFGLISKVTTSE